MKRRDHRKRFAMKLQACGAVVKMNVRVFGRHFAMKIDPVWIKLAMKGLAIFVRFVMKLCN
jgi:hypothetical protein